MTPNGKIQLFPLLRVAVMFAIGVWLGDMLATVVPIVCWVILTIVSLCVSMMFWRRPILQSTLLLLTTLLQGAWIVSAHKADMRLTLPGHPVRFQAVVSSVPVAHGRTVRCDLLVADGALAGRKVRASLMCDSGMCRLACGNGVVVEAQLEYPRNYRMDTNFDYRRWMEVHGFVATAFAYRDRWCPATVSLRSLSRIDRARVAALMLRQRLLERLQTCPDDVRQVVAAMTLGDKSGLDKDRKELYAVSGVSHLLALSGLHLGVIYMLLSLLFARYRDGLLPQVVIVSAIWGYAMMTGLSPGVVRSASMFTLYSLVVLLNRDRMSANTLAFAAVVMLVVNPLYLWDVGFQLSFMAVLGILVFYPPFYHLFKGRRLFDYRLFRWLWSLVCVSVAAQIGVAPLVMYYFGRFSCYFLFANVLAVPIATFIIYCAVVLLLAAPLPVVQRALEDVLVMAVRWLDGGLSMMSRIPGATVENIHLIPLQVVLMYVLVVCLYALGCYAVRMWRSAGYTWK